MGFSHDLLDYRVKFDGLRVLKKPAKTCLILHKKSCTRPEVKAAVKHVRQSGIDVDVYILGAGRTCEGLSGRRLRTVPAE
jgi:hypothetical protein